MPRSVDGIIDEIDRLVDDQMATGEPRTGYDYGDPTYPRCWHCGRQFHGLPITERIAHMYDIGVYDETYIAADDDSRILCLGSDFIGPMPPERRIGTHPGAPWVLPDDLFSPHGWESIGQWAGARREWTIVTGPDSRRWWRLPQLPGNSHLEAVRIVGESAARVTLTIGDERLEWPVGRYRIEHSPDGDRATVDVLAEYAPTIGGTWEPLTAPGSLCHPDDRFGR